MFDPRYLLAMIMEDEEESGQLIYDFSSGKVKLLIDTIRDYFNSDNFDFKCGLVFVHRRQTALLLAFIMQRLRGCDKNFESVKPEFMVASSYMNNDFVDISRKKNETMKR